MFATWHLSARTFLIGVLLVAAACVDKKTPNSVIDSGIISDAAGALDASEPVDRCSPTEVSGPKLEVVVDRQARDALLDLIDSAQSCLDVFEFELLRSGSAGDVRDSVVRAAQRGVHVRVLLDDEVDSNEAAASALRALGVNTRVDNHRTRTHLKMVVADARTLLVGSTNLSGSSIDRNHETNLLVRDASAVSFLTKYLDQLWDDPGLKPEERVASQPSSVVPWVDGGYSTLALPAIETATTTIDLIMYAINLDPRFPDGPVATLADALFDAVKRGLRVRVLLDRSSWNDIINEINEDAARKLRAEGVFVRFDDPGVTTHAKLLIAGNKVMVGTNNWSYGGLARDHEAGVMTDMPEVVAELQTYFESQWSVAR